MHTSQRHRLPGESRGQEGLRRLTSGRLSVRKVKKCVVNRCFVVPASWIPAYAGMTGELCACGSLRRERFAGRFERGGPAGILLPAADGLLGVVVPPRVARIRHQPHHGDHFDFHSLPFQAFPSSFLGHDLVQNSCPEKSGAAHLSVLPFRALLFIRLKMHIVQCESIFYNAE